LAIRRYYEDWCFDTPYFTVNLPQLQLHQVVRELYIGTHRRSHQ